MSFCSRRAVSKHIKWKVEWKGQSGVWVHKQQPFEDCEAKLIQEPGEIHKEWTQEPPHSLCPCV